MHSISIWQHKQSRYIRRCILLIVLVLCGIVGLAHPIPTHMQAYAQDTKGMPANVSSLSLVLQDCDHLLQHDTVVEIRFYGLDIGAFGGVAQWNATPLQLYGRREMVGLIQPHGAGYRVVFYNPSIDWRAQEVQYSFFNPDGFVKLNVQPRQWSFDHTDGSIWHWHVCTSQDSLEEMPTTIVPETTKTAPLIVQETPTLTIIPTNAAIPIPKTSTALPTDEIPTTSVESVEPTALPTAVEPTVTPMVILTLEPTAEPTVIEPTVTPTEMPFIEPTETPFMEPTETPFIEPTETPFMEPTEAPFMEPTEAPFMEPTEAPFMEPTEAPTEAPTEPPSEEMPINVGVAPGLAGPDEKVAFFISGLRAHDTVRYHLIDPSGNIHSDDDFKTGTTPEGRADWTWKVPTEPIPGVWTIVIEAQYTEVTEEISFEVLSGE